MVPPLTDCAEFGGHFLWTGGKFRNCGNVETGGMGVVDARILGRCVTGVRLSESINVRGED
jgi:hypothetical protein